MSSGSGGGGPLVLQFALTGTLSPRLSEDGQAIDFAAGDWAPVVHLAQLKVADARDRELPARFAGWSGDGARGIRILIDDRGASYPLYVDPLATSPSWIGEANQVQANFGYAVATAGDVNGDGYSDVIVGAPYYDNGQTNEGRAFVFHGSAAGLATTAAWSTESNQADANFGFAVATAGDMDGDGYSDVIVGAPNYDNGQTDEGRAYVYCGSSGGLSTTARWTGESNQASSYFGRTVATAGDVQNDGYSDIIVGAHYYDSTFVNEGAAFAYYSDGRYFPVTPSWVAYGGQESALFGFAVGTAGDVNGDGHSDVVVGAPLFDSGEADEGGVFLFRSDGSKLETKASWTGQCNQADAHLGESVGTAGDVNGDGYADIIAGAMYYDNGQVNEGRAFVYHGGAAGSPVWAWSYENDQANSELGRSVGTAGDVNGDGYADVIVSALYYDNGETDEGRASVILGSAGGLEGNASWTAESNQASALFGRSVATAGDVNGDGYSDVIVGAQYYDDGQFDEGAAFVYHGGSNGLSGFYATEIFGPPGELGYTVASAGDVNGDGYADLIAGGPGGNGAKAYYGSASAPTRPPTGPSTASAARASRRPATSMATGSATSSWAIPTTTTGRSTKAGCSCTTDPRRGWRGARAGRRRATMSTPGTDGRSRRRETSTATAMPTSWWVRRTTTTGTSTRVASGSTTARRAARWRTAGGTAATITTICTAPPWPRRAT